MSSRDELRSSRERRWAGKVAERACWYISQPPLELVRLVEAGGVDLRGAALDLGCGPGVVTEYLCEQFALAVGLDVAVGAIEQARERTTSKGRPAAYVVAQAPPLPFEAGTFSLVFERGVLHHLPGSAWPRHFAEVARVLRAGGIYQQYWPHRAPPPLLSLRGLRARVRRALHPVARSASALTTALGPWFDVVETRELPFRTSSGEMVRFTYGTFRKRG
jgi:SAM-dependent methyltransferase